MRLGELARRLSLSLEGNADLELAGLASLEDAGASELAFASSAKYARAFRDSRAGAFVLPPDFERLGRACLRSPTPYVDFARAIELFYPRALPASGVHPSAVVASDAVLGPDVSIGAFSVVGARAVLGARVRLHPHVTVYPDVEIGDDSEIHSGAHLREHVRLGQRVIVHNGAVIGSTGFGFAPGASGSRMRIPHPCGVEIGDDCQIGANTAIDASHPAHRRYGHPTSSTRLGRGVAIDNLVQVGHGCEIRDQATIGALVGLAGSTRVGRHVYMAGGSITAGHLEIGDLSLIGGGSGIVGDLAPGSQVLGRPALERRRFAKIAAAWNRLPELLVRVRKLEAKLGMREGE